MKDRELKEKKILDTVGIIIADEGFEKIGINAVAQKAEISKMLIYRYSGGYDSHSEHAYLNQPTEIRSLSLQMAEMLNISGEYPTILLRLGVWRKAALFQTKKDRRCNHKRVINQPGNHILSIYRQAHAK